MQVRFVHEASHDDARATGRACSSRARIFTLHSRQPGTSGTPGCGYGLGEFIKPIPEQESQDRSALAGGVHDDEGIAQPKVGVVIPDEEDREGGGHAEDRNDGLRVTGTAGTVQRKVRRPAAG